MRPIKLPRRRMLVRAAPELTFQVVAAAGREVERRSDSERVVEFDLEVGGKPITTTELLTLQPPRLILYEWLQGPLPYVEEAIEFVPVGDQDCEMRYTGRFSVGPGLRNWLIGLFVVRRMFDREVVAHLEQGRQAAEERAARSKLYPRRDTA